MRGRRLVAMVLGVFFYPATPALAQQFNRDIVGYYTSWSVYVRDYHVADIPADKINYINYAFANISPDGVIVLGDPYADIDKWYPGDSWHPDSLRGCFHQLQILKRTYPHLKTLISVGGWTWSTYFSNVALTPESRELFAASCVDLVREYDFDGVDIDWEYPVSGGLPDNIYRPVDKQNYTLLLEELRRQLDAAGDYWLTIAGPASPLIIENIEVELVHPYLDWINVMTYDFHGPWGGEADPVTNFNTPVHMVPEDPLSEPYHSTFNLAAAIQAYLDYGVPGEKLHPGLAFYGRGFGNVADYNDGLYATYSGPAPVGTWENGVFDYWDIAQHYVNVAGYAAYWHEEAQVPWVFNPGAQVMISYDDPVSIAAKGEFIKDLDLGGAMFWEFSADRNADLLNTIHEVLMDTTACAVRGPGARTRPQPRLLASRPSPACGSTVIRFDLPERSEVNVAIFDAEGRLRRTLTNRTWAPGLHTLSWDGLCADGTQAEAGTYCCRLLTSNCHQITRIVVLR